MGCHGAWFLLLFFLRVQKQTAFGVTLVTESTASFLVSRQNAWNFRLWGMTSAATLFKAAFAGQELNTNFLFLFIQTLRGLLGLVDIVGTVHVFDVPDGSYFSCRKMMLITEQFLFEKNARDGMKFDDGRR